MCEGMDGIIKEPVVTVSLEGPHTSGTSSDVSYTAINEAQWH